VSAHHGLFRSHSLREMVGGRTSGVIPADRNARSNSLARVPAPRSHGGPRSHLECGAVIINDGTGVLNCGGAAIASGR